MRCTRSQRCFSKRQQLELIPTVQRENELEEGHGRKVAESNESASCSCLRVTSKQDVMDQYIHHVTLPGYSLQRAGSQTSPANHYTFLMYDKLSRIIIQLTPLSHIWYALINQHKPGQPSPCSIFKSKTVQGRFLTPGCASLCSHSQRTFSCRTRQTRQPSRQLISGSPLSSR